VTTGPVRYIILGALLAALMVLGGCAYTVTTVEVDPPKPGPPVHTGQAAVMDQVKDARSWPTEAPKERIPHVRIFAPDMTKILRQELTQRGLFTSLPLPDTPAAEAAKAELKVTINSFALENVGMNPWLVPHILLDGAALPVFTVVMVGTGGEIDLGGYAFPSTSMATNLNASVNWNEPWRKEPVVTRAYTVSLSIGGVSEREMKQRMSDPRTHGVTVGREAGLKAMTELANLMSRDPHWAYLQDYSRLAKAEDMLKLYNQGPKPSQALPTPAAAERAWPTPYRSFSARTEVQVDTARNAPPGMQPPAQGGKTAVQAPAATEEKVAEELPPPTLAEMVNQVRGLLSILRPLAFTPDEVSILTDGYLEAEKRASIVNSIRAQQLGLENVANLPADQLLDEGAATELYDSPAVARAQVEAVLVERVLTLAVGVLTPRTEAPSAQAKALRQGLINDLAAKLKDKPKLQVLLLARAERAVRDSWPPMQELLKMVGSPMTQRYLANRAD
jgi:hypothetical protein